MNNLVILKQMIRLSALMKEIKEARRKSSLIIAKSNFFILKGDFSDSLHEMCENHIDKCLFLEMHLRSSVSDACKFLDGFDSSRMDPIGYISGDDVKNKSVDICRGNKIVATIDLTTGFITKVKTRELNSGEDKSPVDKKLAVQTT